MKQKKILIAPLDWGLGHATRCIPIIRELENLNCRIFIASEGVQAALLKREFPNASFLHLSGYHIRYSKTEKGFGLKILTQLPKIQKAIRLEHQLLKKMAGKWKPDAILSDNRFGFYHPDIPSVIMTHQLHPISPFGKTGADMSLRINYHYLKKFNACWVVDFEDKNYNLAGKLSHPAFPPPLNIKYIGALSRFSTTDYFPIKYDLLVLISGPEPQRSKFEALICRQISGLPLKTLIVCGQPDKPKEIQLSPTIKLVNHLDTAALQAAIQQSKMILSRPGYTTIMDMIQLEKKAIFIPTPGQTEQEYLAKILQKKGRFLSFSQKDFQLKKALEAAADFPFQSFSLPEKTIYKQVVKDFIAGL